MNPFVQALLTKAGTFAVSEPLKRALKWARRKVIPFDASKIIVEFQSMPGLTCNHEEGFFAFYSIIQVQNLSYYPVQIYSCELRYSISGYEFMPLTSAKLLMLEPTKKGQFEFRKSLDVYEVKRLEGIFGQSDAKVAHFQISISLATKDGVETIPPIGKTGCVTMCSVLGSHRLRLTGSN